MPIFFRTDAYSNPNPTPDASFHYINTIEIVSEVTERKNFYPLTGKFSEDVVEGWLWSRSIPQDLLLRERRIENSLGGYEYNLEDGSLLEYWKGAVLAGIELRDIINSKSKKMRTEWIPRVSDGEFSIYHLKKKLYSDFSSCKLLKEAPPIGSDDNNEDGTVTLDLEAHEINNIEIVAFKRDKRFVNLPFVKYVYDDELQEKYSYYINTIESNDGNEPIYTLVANREYRKEIGCDFDVISPADAHDLRRRWEFAGLGNENRSIIYTEYFPIDEESFELYQYDTISKAYEKWNKVPKFSFNDQYEYMLDPYKGIVLINSVAPMSFKPKSATIDDDNIIISFYEELTEWPLKEGKIEFVCKEDDVIYKAQTDYYDKIENSISIKASDLWTDSGANSSFVAGSLNNTFLTMSKEEFQEKIEDDATNVGNRRIEIFVKFLQQGKNFNNGEEILLKYTSLARVNYSAESIDEDLDFRTCKDVNLKPYTSIDSAGILEITPYEKHISEITLECSLDLVDGIYKTLYMGSESARITAIVKNSSGGRMKDCEVDFHSNFGIFNSGTNPTKGYTNREGEAFTYFSWPYEEKSNHIFGEEVISSPQGGSSIVVDALSIDGSSTAKDALVFQVAKTDPFYGGYGSIFLIKEVSLAGNYIHIEMEKEIPDIEEYVSNEMLYVEYESLNLEGILKNNFINHSIGLIRWNNNGLPGLSEFSGFQKVIFDKIINKKTIAFNKIFLTSNGIDDVNEWIDTVNGNSDRNRGAPNRMHAPKVHIFKRNELFFDKEKVKKGFSYDRLMYKDDGDDLEPLTPDAITLNGNEYRIVYSNVELPIGSLTNTSNLIAGYKLFLDRLATLHATAIDPASGRIVRSNNIKIKVSLPEFLKGEHGFKFIENNDQKESALGGSNFLKLDQGSIEGPDSPDGLVTVNPFYRNRINLFLNNSNE